MDAHEFVTFSASKLLSPRSPDPPRELVQAFLTDYMEALGQAGCDMVGHIKGMVEAGGSPPLFFSITSQAGVPQLKGGPLGHGNDLTLGMTVIVSGVETQELSRLLDNSLAKYFSTTSAVDDGNQ
jgi:hypothetical protein